MSRSSFFFIFLLFGELLTACRREGKETDMRADSVYHVPSSKRQKKNSLISLCVCVCVFCSVFLSNLKWQEMKSAVICVDWDRIKNSLVCKGWKDRCYIGLDSSKMQMLMLSCHFVLLFFFFFLHLIQDIWLMWVCILWAKHQTRLIRSSSDVAKWDVISLCLCGADHSERCDTPTGELRRHVLLCTSVHLSNALWSDIKSAKSLDPWISCQTIFSHTNARSHTHKGRWRSASKKHEGRRE